MRAQFHFAGTTSVQRGSRTGEFGRTRDLHSLMSGSKSASRVSKTFDVDAYDILMAIDKEIARRAELARAKRNGEIVFRF